MPGSIKKQQEAIPMVMQPLAYRKKQAKLSIEATRQDPAKVFKEAYHHVVSKAFSCQYIDFS